MAAARDNAVVAPLVNTLSFQTTGSMLKGLSGFECGIAEAMADQWGDLDGLAPFQRQLFEVAA